MKNKNIIFAVFLMIIGIQFSIAQKVDVHNKVEYSQEKESGIEDLNSIDVSENIRLKKGKKGVSNENISIEDLERIVVKRKAKRYRKVRGGRDMDAGKCFKSENDEEKDCENK